MKQKFLFLALLAVLLITTGRAQVIVPDSYTAVHSDSCWYITMN